MASSWDAVAAFATSTFPETETSTTYASPSLKVKGRLIARLRREADAPGALALRCSSSDKQALVTGGDPAFFTTPHYDGYDYVLVDLDRVDHEELLELVTEAWLLVAPARVRQAWEAARA